MTSEHLQHSLGTSTSASLNTALYPDLPASVPRISTHALLIQTGFSENMDLAKREGVISSRKWFSCAITNSLWKAWLGLNVYIPSAHKWLERNSKRLPFFTHVYVPFIVLYTQSYTDHGIFRMRGIIVKLETRKWIPFKESSGPFECRAWNVLLRCSMFYSPYDLTMNSILQLCPAGCGLELWQGQKTSQRLSIHSYLGKHSKQALFSFNWDSPFRFFS